MLEIVAIIGNFFPSSQASSLGECSLRHRSQRPHILFMIAFNRHEAWSKSVNVTHTSRLRIVSQTSKSVTMKSPNNLIKVFVLCLSCCVSSILAQRPDFQAPFHCGQKWTANTYSKHTPTPTQLIWICMMPQAPTLEIFNLLSLPQQERSDYTWPSGHAKDHNDRIVFQEGGHSHRDGTLGKCRSPRNLP